ncbi:MAG: M48 family metalloprotease [Flavobacteriales bacterium]|nr:M48 family metalloprotease [Flavobacteriales bacterium]
MRLPLFLISIAFTGSWATAQVRNTIYHFPKEIPATYRVDARGDFERMAAEPYEDHKSRDLERFAEMTAYAKRHLLASGKVYFDPPAAEVYLDKVATRLLGTSGKVKVYLMRDASYNAFCIHDGSLFVNVGILAELPDESALAGIMGHEIAHFLRDHNRAGFFNKLDLYTRKNRNRNYELRIDKAHDDRAQEHEADSIGATLARKAGYDLQGLISSFLLLLPEPTDSTAMSAAGNAVSARDALLSDHPETRDRIDFLNKWLELDPDMRGGEAELVDASAFEDLRRMARMEALQVLLEQHQYPACAERAFRYLLLEPEAKGYLQFLTESLRRWTYIVPDAGFDGFLTYGREQKFQPGKGVLNDLGYILRDSALLAQAHTADYFVDGKPRFETNDEALRHFLEEADRANVVEALLSKALYYRKDISIRDAALDRYTAMGGSASAFVEAWRGGQLDKRLRKCKGGLVLLEEIDFIEDHVYGFRQRHVLAEDRGPYFNGAVRSMLARKFPERTIVDVSDLKHNDMPSFLNYDQAAGNMAIVEWMWDAEMDRAKRRDRLRAEARERRTKRKTIEKRSTDADTLANVEREELEDALETTKLKRRKRTKKEMKFYYIDPYYWQFLVEQGFGSVEAISVRAFDDRTRIVGNAFGAILWLYPGYWMTRLDGSNRYGFELSHVKFSTESQQVRMRQAVINYKMTRPHLKSAVYESMFDIDQ